MFSKPSFLETFQRKGKWKNFDGNINILSNINDSDISKILSEKGIHSIQLYEFTQPSKSTWQSLNKLFEKNPDIGLRVLNHEKLNFSFYELIPSVRRVSIASYNTKDFTPLLFNKELKSLGIEETKSTTTDLSFIKEFKQLESVYIDGMKKGLENIQHLPCLETLTLRGIKMKSLNFIKDLSSLRHLKLLFGSYKDLDGIFNLTKLESLEISRTRQIPNYDFLNGLKNLKSLTLEGMSQLEKLPNLSELSRLSEIRIENNRKLIDISGLSGLKALNKIILTFPEKINASQKKALLDQVFEVILSSKTVLSTNVWFWANKELRDKMKKKGIEFYGWNPSLEKELKK